MTYELFDHQLLRTIDKVQAALAAERPNKGLVKLLEDIDLVALSTLIEDFETLIVAVEEAAEAGVFWRDAEGKGEKLDTREDFFETLESLNAAFEPFSGLDHRGLTH